MEYVNPENVTYDCNECEILDTRAPYPKKVGFVGVCPPDCVKCMQKILTEKDGLGARS